MIPGLDGDYSISKCGRIYSHKRKGRWLTPSTSHKGGYLTIVLNRKCLYVHRIMAAAFLRNALKGGAHVDHIDGNPRNNDISNLRLCTRAQNNRNSGTRRNGKIPFKGVCRVGNRFRAQIVVDRNHTHLGYFDSPEEPAKAYDVAATSNFKEFASLNFPDNASV